MNNSIIFPIILILSKVCWILSCRDGFFVRIRLIILNVWNNPPSTPKKIFTKKKKIICTQYLKFLPYQHRWLIQHNGVMWNPIFPRSIKGNCTIYHQLIQCLWWYIWHHVCCCRHICHHPSCCVLWAIIKDNL